MDKIKECRYISGKTMLTRCATMLLLLWLDLVGAVGTVHADAAADAEKLVSEGVELRRLGNDDAALVKFQAAYKIAPTPRQTAQLGLCEQAVGRWTDAEKHLSGAIENRTDPWVAKYATVLRESLEIAKANVGRLELVGGPPGASVTVNGSDVGILPLLQPVKVNAGQVFIAVSNAGYERWSSTLNVAGGNYQRVVVDMKKEPPAVAINDLVPRPPAARVEELAVNDGPQPGERHTQSMFGTWWFWTAATAVVAGVVVSAIVLSSGAAAEPSCPIGVDACGTRNK